MELFSGKKGLIVGMGGIYLSIGVIFILVTFLNIYTYFTIVGANSTFADTAACVSNFQLEYIKAVQALQPSDRKDRKEKDDKKQEKVAETVWTHLTNVENCIRDLETLQGKQQALHKNLSEFRENAKIIDDADRSREEKTEALIKCVRLRTQAEKTVIELEESVKDAIGNESALARFMYLVLILANVGAFSGIFFVIFYNERRYKARARLLNGENSNLSAQLKGFDSVIFVIDSKGMIRSWNMNAERFLDKTDEEAIDHNIFELFPFFTQFKPLFDTALYSNKRTFRYHEKVSINRGPMRALNVLCVPLIVGDTDSSNELLIKIDDVTSFRIDDERYIQEQKIHAMYAMLESVERDSAPLMESIGESMETINGFAEAAGNAGDVVPYTAYMRNALAQIGIIPQLYMSAVAGTSFSKTMIDLNEMIMYVLRLSQKTFDPRVSIEISLNETRSWVMANPVRLFYAFLNIVNNAEDAMISMRKEGEEMGGILSVSVERIPGERVSIDKIIRYRQKFEDEPSYWIILVTDTGVGIPPEEKGQVFDPFFTTKNKLEHKGLGLSTVSNIVNELNGHLDISSKVGRGTVFKLFLPEAKDAVKGDGTADDSLNSDDSQIVQGTGKLLLIIDDVLLCNVMAKLFRKLGYEVVPAGNGFQAVNIFAADPDSFKGVIIDISTKYMTAADTLFQLQAIKEDVQVIVAQNSDRDEAIRTLKSHGFHNFIQKPYPVDLISRKLAEFQ